MQDKKPEKDNGDAHGYWEVFYDNGKLHFKGMFIDNNVHGEYECYYLNGNMVLRCHMFDKKVYGHCIHYTKFSYHAI